MVQRSLAAMLCASTALAVAHSALAQEPQGTVQVQEATQIETITVTAQRRDQDLSEVPMSITALSGEQMANLGITDVADLVKVTPGLSYVDSGAATPVYSLRGVGFFDQSIGARPTVSIYVDQTPLPFSIMSSGASFDLARVEVLKGPQGTLFGQNSTGGAINYVAARPTDEFEGGMTLGYGRFNTVEAAGYVSGPISDTLNARLALRAENGDGWQQSYTRDDTHGARRFFQGRFIADWRPTDDFELSFTLSGFADNSDTQAAQLIGLIIQTPDKIDQIPDLLTYPLAPNEARAADWNDAGFPLRRDNDFHQGALRATYNLTDNITLISLTSYAEMDIHQRLDLDATSIAAVYTEDRGNIESFAQEFRLTGDYARVNWVIGASYAHDETSQLNDYSFGYSTGAGLPTGEFDRVLRDLTQEFETIAAFGNIDYDITDTVTLTGGLRYTRTDLDYAACSRAGNQGTADGLTAFFNFLRGTGGQPPIPPLAVGDCLTVDPTLTPGLVTGELNEDNVSWRLGASWAPVPRTLLYANISQGYKGGSAPTPPALAANQLDPVVQESVRAYEVGFRSPVYSHYLDASGAVFYYDYQDKQLMSRTMVEPSLLGALEALVNVPESRVWGIELQLNARPIPGLTLSVAGTYINSEITSDFDGYTITGAAGNFRGESFPYTPEWQLVAQGQYEWPVADNVDAFVGGNINYRSSTTAGFGEIPILDIDSYTLVDIQGGFSASDGSWQVMAYARNLTDEFYWTNVGKLNDTVRRLAGMPRTYGIQVSRRF